MPNIIVVNQPGEWPSPPKGVELLSAKDYLRGDKLPRAGRFKVLNLCTSQGYQSLGYYVSLLATARGHKVVPGVDKPQDIKSRSFLKSISEELAPATKSAFATESQDRVKVTALLGETTEEPHRRLAKQLFSLLQLPLIDAHFARSKEGWSLSRVELLNSRTWTPAQKSSALELAARYFQRWAPAKRPKAYRYDLAILYDPRAENTPSNPKALERFERQAEALDVYVERIERTDLGRLTEFDGLFIRETTFVNHHTYRFARAAQVQGLVVIDDPDSILRCTNKIFLAELLHRNKVPTPQTKIIAKEEVEALSRQLVYPQVIKRPDGAFSLGSYKVSSPDEFIEGARNLLKNSELILAQPFLPTEYDWRIGVLGGAPLFACRYFMAKNHWQIVKREGAKEHEGQHQTLAVEAAPKAIVDAALAATKLIGDGLYGVDLKEINGQPYVIEVNDNPNIDAGVEDQHLREELYRRIVKLFVDRIEALKVRRGLP